MAKSTRQKDFVKRQSSKKAPPLTVSRAFGQKSPLINTDLQAFLARCLNADQLHKYTDEERARILESFPKSRTSKSLSVEDSTTKDSESGQPLDLPQSATTICALQESKVGHNGMPWIALDSFNLRTDVYLKRATARFQRDLGDGYYEKSWQDKARRAHKDRMDGKLDDYVKQYAEEIFEENSSLAGDDNEQQDDAAQASDDGEYSEKPPTGTGDRKQLKKVR